MYINNECDYASHGTLFPPPRISCSVNKLSISDLKKRRGYRLTVVGVRLQTRLELAALVQRDGGGSIAAVGVSVDGD